MTKSTWEFFLNGKALRKDGNKTSRVEIQEGDVVVLRYNSPWVYDGFACAFATSDRKEMLPLRREHLRRVDASLSPADVTAELVAKSTEGAPSGRPDKNFNERWHALELEPVGKDGSEWAGVNTKKKDYQFAFVVDPKNFAPLK